MQKLYNENLHQTSTHTTCNSINSLVLTDLRSSKKIFTSCFSVFLPYSICQLLPISGQRHAIGQPLSACMRISTTSAGLAAKAAVEPASKPEPIRQGNDTSVVVWWREVFVKLGSSFSRSGKINALKHLQQLASHMVESYRTVDG